MKELFVTELEYLRAFCLVEESGDLLRFSDPEIPDMYSHNLTYIKDYMPATDLAGIISREIVRAREMGRAFLNIQTDIEIDRGMLSDLPLAPETFCHYDYYVFGNSNTDSLRGRADCSIQQLTVALRDEALSLDLRANETDMGVDFVTRRFARRSRVYLDEGGVDNFLCFQEGNAVGHADLFISGDIAKIEDVDVAPDSQRKGFGTTMLKSMIERAWAKGAKHIYLITDHDETAKDMYEKIGFSNVAQKTELLFRLS